jgi:hypothetical protein
MGPEPIGETQADQVTCSHDRVGFASHGKMLPSEPHSIGRRSPNYAVGCKAAIRANCTVWPPPMTSPHMPPHDPLHIPHL